MRETAIRIPGPTNDALVYITADDACVITVGKSKRERNWPCDGNRFVRRRETLHEPAD